MYSEQPVSSLFEVAMGKTVALSDSIKKKYSSHISSERLLGIELEVEKTHFKTKLSPQVWVGVPDGSLRNNGAEYKSNGPIKFCDLVPALHYFKDSVSYAISPRCSSHVHVNVQNLSLNVVERIFKFYMHIEKDLFKFVGKNRHKNIYCIPLWDTLFGLQPFQKSITSYRGLYKVVWSKYTALNFCTIPSLGTIEFRHYPGLVDINHYVNFISIIDHMISFCENDDPSKLSYNDMCSIVNLQINKQEYDNARLLFTGE